MRTKKFRRPERRFKNRRLEEFGVTYDICISKEVSAADRRRIPQPSTGESYGEGEGNFCPPYDP